MALFSKGTLKDPRVMETALVCELGLILAWLGLRASDDCIYMYMRMHMFVHIICIHMYIYTFIDTCCTYT